MPHPRSPRAWDQAYISYVCVVCTSKISTLCLSHWIQHFCTASQFCSVSGGNLIKHFFNRGAGRAFCFPLVFCIIAVKDPFTFTKCFSVLLRVHGAYMSARVNYHLPGNIFFFLFFSMGPLSGYIQCGKC